MATATKAPARRFDNRLLPPMVLGAILNPINSSILAVALIPIGVAFGASPSSTAWLVSGLYLATAIGQPLIGRFVDTYGPKRMFLIGASLTFVAGVVGTFAPSLWVLVVARVILGFGTCAGYPAAMYLIRSESKRTGIDSPAGVLTILSVSTQTIAVIGPTLGGLLIGLGGWRSTLAVNIVLGGAALILGALFLPSRTPLQAESKKNEPVDLVGIAFFCATLISLLLFLMDPHTAKLWLLAITALAGLAFGWWELRRQAPFIDLRVLGGNLPLVRTYLRSLLVMTVSYSFMYGYSQWLEDGRGLSAAHAGLMLMPSFAVGVLITTITGRRAAVRAKLLVGSAVQIVCCLLVFRTGDHSPIWLLVAITALLGIPQGMVNLALQNALYFQARPDKIGASAGLLRTFGYLGAILASAAAGLFFGSAASTSGLHHLGIFMVGAALIFLLITVTDRTLGSVGRDGSDPKPA